MSPVSKPPEHTVWKRRSQWSISWDLVIGEFQSEGGMRPTHLRPPLVRLLSDCLCMGGAVCVYVGADVRLLGALGGEAGGDGVDGDLLSFGHGDGNGTR